MEVTAKPKLSKTILNGFGLGDGGFQFIVNMELMYFALFLTDFCKFSPQLAGTILTVTSIVDIFCVIIAGAIVEKSNYKWMKWGKHRSWLLIGPPITYICFIPMFTYIGGSMAPLVIGLGFVTSHLIWNVVYTAHISLINVMTDDPFERTKLSASRQTCSTIAKIIFGYVVLNSVTKMGESTTPTTGWMLGAAIWAIVMVLGYWAVFKITDGHDVSTVAVDSSKKADKVPLSLLLSETFKNTQLLVLMFADFFRCLAYYLLTGTAIYYFNKIFADKKNWAIYLVLINLTSFFGTLIAPVFAKRFGKKLTYVVGVFTYAIFLIIVNLFANTDIFFMAAIGAGTMILQFSFCMITAMFADTVTYGEWKTGKNIRGFVMGLLSMPIKLSVFARSAIIGGMLTAMQYAPDVAATSAEISGIKMMVTVIPAGACIASGLIIFFAYTLTDSKLVQLSNEINERKAKQAEVVQ